MFKVIKKLFSAEKTEAETNLQGKSVSDSGVNVEQMYAEANHVFEQGDSVAALDLFLRVTEIDPQHLKSLLMLGFLYKQRGNIKSSKIYLLRALAIDEQSADANYMLGTIAAAENDKEAMQGFLRRSLELDPLQEHIYLEFSFALFQIGHGQQAIELLQTGLLHFPKHVGMLQYLGNIQLSLQQFYEAYATFSELISLVPDAIELRISQFACCSNLAKFDEALQHLLHIQKLDPEHVLANSEEGLLRLRRGEFELGWRKYEWRWRVPELEAIRFKSDKPKWDGSQDLRGKTILILSEQGLGDTIQFCRLIPEVKARGARVIFVVAAPLMDLMRQIAGVDELSNSRSPQLHFDYYCELMSLPYALGLTAADIPCADQYLQCPIEKKTLWQNRLPNSKKAFRIGLVWAGNPQHSKNHLRSIPFETIADLFELDAEFLILQKEVTPDERAALSKYEHVSFHGEQIIDFTDTAGLVEQVDLVVTVDTSLAHLAGAMGKRTWILLSYFPDWRWMENTEQTPWYQSARLMRQGVLKPWSDTIIQLKYELAQVIAEHQA